ncbi:helix-turn-helix domain-containing protein [Candidatus Binatus sp.]|uniref:helix-turn-helix domain-containing protein n=1 Tax=Candidatus Binatus sp. TaxID=2811406 RepID=UPI003BAE8893
MKTDRLSPLTIEQAASELGVSPHTIRAWIGQRRLGHLKLGRAVRVPRTEVQRLIERSFTPALPERDMR